MTTNQYLLLLASRQTKPISNTEDYIDSRDIVERINYLEIGEPDVDETEELESLRSLVEELKNCAGDSPEDGITLVRDSYFEDHAQELAEDIGAIDRNATWPLYCIDWTQAARDLQMDYSSVEFDGVTYWVR